MKSQGGSGHSWFRTYLNSLDQSAEWTVVRQMQPRAGDGNCAISRGLEYKAFDLRKACGLPANQLKVGRKLKDIA